MENERVALSKPSVQAALAKDFVFIKLYTNQGGDEKIARVKDLRNRFEGGGANPWYVFLSPNGRVMKRFGGQLTKDGFLATLAEMKAEADRVAKTH